MLVIPTVGAQFSEVSFALADVGQDLKVGRVALEMDAQDNCL